VCEGERASELPGITQQSSDQANELKRKIVSVLRDRVAVYEALREFWEEKRKTKARQDREYIKRNISRAQIERAAPQRALVSAEMIECN
jgi:hypothetical protein